MLKNTLAAALCAMALFACDARDTPDTDNGATPAVTANAGDADRAVFVTPPTSPDAQLVFVGQDESVMPADRSDAVFVPFSTFSVERDGIPNEFPAPDSMAGLLADAGVHGSDVVLVGEPIPVGRAYAAFDYLGLGGRATVLDGGPTVLNDAADTAASAAVSDTARAADAARARVQISARSDMIVDAAWVHARLDDPGVAILDARPPAEYSGETPGDGIERPGHIPGARNVFWQTLVRSPDDARLKDETELRRMFTDAGVEPGDTVVAYCRTGGQASFLYTVAKHLGYDVRLYDGSYVDWSRTEYPVER